RPTEAAGCLAGPPLRLITSIAFGRTRPAETRVDRPCAPHRPCPSRSRTAAISPGVARRFPFFAALRTRSRVFPCVGMGQLGRLAMTIRAGGRVALIAATGLLVWVAGMSWTTAAPAAAEQKSENVSTSKTVKHVRYYKRHAHRKYVRTAQ